MAKTARAPAVHDHTAGGKARTMLPNGGSGRGGLVLKDRQAKYAWAEEGSVRPKAGNAGVECPNGVLPLMT